jgi:hypothetical protein
LPANSCSPDPGSGVRDPELDAHSITHRESSTSGTPLSDKGARRVEELQVVQSEKGRGARMPGAYQRTTGYRFAGPQTPFFPFPAAYVDATGFLGNLHRGQAATAALKI